MPTLEQNQALEFVDVQRRRINFRTVVELLMKHIQGEDWTMKKVWSQRIARNLVEWFKLTNQLAFNYPFTRAAIMKAQSARARLFG